MKLPIVIVLLASLAGGACGRHLYDRRDLDVDMAKHHIDLRWGRLGEAAMRVHPDMRGAFMEDWAKRAETVELQDLEIVGATLDEDGDSADVVLAVTYVDRTTLQVKRATVAEKWQRTDDGWRVVRPLELPADAPAPPVSVDVPPD